jgi:hypothetical protein
MLVLFTYFRTCVLNCNIWISSAGTPNATLPSCQCTQSAGAFVLQDNLSIDFSYQLLMVIIYSSIRHHDRLIITYVHCISSLRTLLLRASTLPSHPLSTFKQCKLRWYRNHSKSWSISNANSHSCNEMHLAPNVNSSKFKRRVMRATQQSDENVPNPPYCSVPHLCSERGPLEKLKL